MKDTRPHGVGLATAVVLVAVLTGCAPDPSPTPTPSVTSSATTAPARTPSPTPTPTADAEMTGDEAAAICLTLVEPGLRSSVITGEPQIHERAVDPRWLILFPAENGISAHQVMCVIGGDPANPDVLSTSVRSTLTPEELATRLASNDEFGY